MTLSSYGKTGGWKGGGLTKVGLCPSWDIKWLPESLDDAKQLDTEHRKRVSAGLELCICGGMPGGSDG